MEADKDGDGKLDFAEFTNMVAATVRLISQYHQDPCLPVFFFSQDVLKQLTLEDLF